jgi:hypothetical protein
MKQCARCYRQYTDETIAFCLDDGTPLTPSSDQAATLIMPQARATEQIPPVVSPPASPIPSAQPQIIKQGVSPYFAYALVGLIAMLIAGGAVVLFYESRKDNATAVTKTAETSQPSPTAASNNTPVKTQTTDQTANGKTGSRTTMSNSVPGKYPEGSTRLLTADDLAGKSPWELKVMRNEIYARHGYIFKNTELRDYFEKQSWYKPVSDDVTNLLSDVEKRNADFLKNYG